MTGKGGGSSEARYKNFLKTIAETKQIYILWEKDTGQIFSSISSEYFDESHHPIPIFHFWSTKIYPNEWLRKFDKMAKGFELVNIDIYEFKELITKLYEFRVTLGIEWDQHAIGKEVMPEAMMYELEIMIKTIESSQRY